MTLMDIWVSEEGRGSAQGFPAGVAHMVPSYAKVSEEQFAAFLVHKHR